MIEIAKLLDMCRRRLKPLLILMGCLRAAEAAPFQSESQIYVLGNGRSGSLAPASARSHCAALDTGFFFFHRLTRPGHARRVVCDAELPLSVQHDDAAMTVQSLF
jgi:hypothetical protein